MERAPLGAPYFIYFYTFILFIILIIYLFLNISVFFPFLFFLFLCTVTSMILCLCCFGLSYKLGDLFFSFHLPGLLLLLPFPPLPISIFATRFFATPNPPDPTNKPPHDSSKRQHPHMRHGASAAASASGAQRDAGRVGAASYACIAPDDWQDAADPHREEQGEGKEGEEQATEQCT